MTASGLRLRLVGVRRRQPIRHRGRGTRRPPKPADADAVVLRGRRCVDTESARRAKRTPRTRAQLREALGDGVRDRPGTGAPGPGRRGPVRPRRGALRSHARPRTHPAPTHARQGPRPSVAVGHPPLLLAAARRWPARTGGSLLRRPRGCPAGWSSCAADDATQTFLTEYRGYLRTQARARADAAIEAERGAPHAATERLQDRLHRDRRSRHPRSLGRGGAQRQGPRGRHARAPPPPPRRASHQRSVPVRRPTGAPRPVGPRSRGCGGAGRAFGTQRRHRC